MFFSLLLLSFLAASSVLAGSNKESADWLKENSSKEGVVSLPSGLQYKIQKSGSGKLHPTVDSPCECHYKGTLIDGTQFDSSYDRGEPTTFAPNQVIAGWTEAMQLMVEGDKWELYIPSDIAYGDQGSPPKIGGGDALVFTLELLKIKGDKVPKLTCNALTLDGCNDKEKAYVQKASKKFDDADSLEDEIQRITKTVMTVKSDTLLEWANRRMHILNKLLTSAAEEEL